MTRVLALTFGDESQASSFFRVHQYAQPLARVGIQVETHPARAFASWQSVSSYDVVLVQKSLPRLGVLRHLRRLSRRLVYDIDDAVWHPHGRKHFFLTNLRQNLRLKKIVASADLTVAANHVIARHLGRWTSRLAVVPMALDEERWIIRSGEQNGRKVRIGWSGSPVNLRYLEAIEPALADVQARHDEVEFAVLCGQTPQFKHLQFVHIPFVSGREAEAIRTFDVGLLPLPNNDFAAGKSPIKGLQYMASGAAAEMFEEGRTALFAPDNQHWTERLRRLVQDGALRRMLTENARAAFLKKFSLSANLPRVAGSLTGSGELLS